MTVFVETVRMAKSKQSMNQSERSDLPQGYLAIQQLLIIRFQAGSDKKNSMTVLPGSILAQPYVEMTSIIDSLRILYFTKPIIRNKTKKI